MAVENFAGWKFSLTFALIQKSYVAGFIVYLAINLGLVFSSVYIVTHFAPAAAGSGIPEIKGYLNGMSYYWWLFASILGKIKTHCFWAFESISFVLMNRNWHSWCPFLQNLNRKGTVVPYPSLLEISADMFLKFSHFFSFRNLGICQIFGSIGSVGGGLALGKEGPLVHTGACIASLLGQVSLHEFLVVIFLWQSISSQSNEKVDFINPCLIQLGSYFHLSINVYVPITAEVVLLFHTCLKLWCRGCLVSIWYWDSLFNTLIHDVQVSDLVDLWKWNMSACTYIPSVFVRSHVSCGGEWNTLYKGVKTSPWQTRFTNLEGNPKGKTQIGQYLRWAWVVTVFLLESCEIISVL